MGDRSTSAPTIAITGAAGYIGSRIVREIQANHTDWRLIPIDNFHLGKVDSVGGLTIEEADIRDRESLFQSLDGADIVIHLAAISGVDDCDEAPDLAYETNVQGTNNVAWFCRQSGAAMIFPFSMAVLGDPTKFPITADQPRNPMNWYARTKYLGELTTKVMAQGAFPAHLLMKSNLYGHHTIDGTEISKPTVTNFFIERALEGEPLTVYKPGTQSRNYVHVKDVVNAYIKSIERLLVKLREQKTGARTYEIASEEDPSVKKLAELVSTIAYEERGIDVPVELVSNPRGNETLVSEFSVDTSEARADLDWAPEHTIEATVRNMFSPD